METVVFTIGELSGQQRRAAEELLGHALSDHQQIRIEVCPSESQTDVAGSGDDDLPEWCNVYKGYSPEEIDRLEQSILENRFHLERPGD